MNSLYWRDTRILLALESNVSMSEGEDDGPLMFNRADLEARFTFVLSTLARMVPALDSESHADIQRFQQCLDDLMKVFHDSRHSSCGVVKDGSPVEDVRWLETHYDAAISALDEWGLGDKEEAMDLRSERTMLLKAFALDDRDDAKWQEPNKQLIRPSTALSTEDSDAFQVLRQAEDPVSTGNDDLHEEIGALGAQKVIRVMWSLL